MKANIAVFGLLAHGSLSLLFARAETHGAFQAVNANGTSAWAGGDSVTLVGVLLTDSGEMLDSTPNFVPWNDGANIFNLGAEWQVAIQAVGASDRGGTFLYMGQSYGNMPWLRSSDFSYTDEAWSAELGRLNHDMATGRAFRKGDLVSVTAARSAFYGGKRNINETHEVEPTADFSVSLVIPDFGLPAPEVLSLASLVRENDNNTSTREDIFDRIRATGGEYWQGMRVRLTGLKLAATDGWNPNAPWSGRIVSATDEEGRIFNLRHPRQSLGSPPTGRFDAIGVLNQESGSGTDGTYGYELFVQEIAPASEPVLGIANQLVISWPGSLSNYQLQSRDSLSANWLETTNAPALWNGRNTVIQNLEGDGKMFRLERVQ